MSFPALGDYDYGEFAILNRDPKSQFVIGLAEAATGMKAAWLWWKASKVNPTIGPLEAGLIAHRLPVEDLSRIEAAHGLLFERLEASLDSADVAASMNRCAAVWTACSVRRGALNVVLRCFTDLSFRFGQFEGWQCSNPSVE